MGPKSKYRLSRGENYAKRHKVNDNVSSSSSINQYIPFEVVPFEENIVSISDDDNLNKGCQTDDLISDSNKINLDENKKNINKSVMDEFTFSNVADLIDILIDSCPKWSSINNRILSMIIYITLRKGNIQFEEARKILKDLNLLSIQTCHSWLLTIAEEDDLCVLLNDGRGKYKRELFYELYPDLELLAKSYSLENASKKNCSFAVKNLANFIDKEFISIYGKTLHDDLIDSNEQMIRSVESCRVDLIRWGAKWDSNSNRPYFEGHEREDVVAKPKEFVEYFVDNKDFYYYGYRDENNNAKFNVPISNESRKKRILISHDESTFRSGELPSHRWMFPDLAPFFNKGRGRSIMVSGFIVQHSECDVFLLDEEEWREAIKKFPEFNEEDKFLNYFPRSANAWIEPKKDNYFDNEIILRQFERLLKLIEFKKSFADHQIEILVDNARTHSAKIYDISLLNKNSGTNCPYEKLEWSENEIVKSIDLFDNNGVSKGLFVVA